MYREVFHQISFSDFNQSCGMQLDINNEWIILADTDEGVEFEIDDMNNNEISNPAHKIIYQNLRDKFNEFLSNKTQFLDESEALYKDALQKYQV